MADSNEEKKRFFKYYKQRKRITNRLRINSEDVIKRLLSFFINRGFYSGFEYNGGNHNDKYYGLDKPEPLDIVDQAAMIHDNDRWNPEKREAHDDWRITSVADLKLAKTFFAGIFKRITAYDPYSKTYRSIPLSDNIFARFYCFLGAIGAFAVSFFEIFLGRLLGLHNYETPETVKRFIDIINNGKSSGNLHPHNKNVA